MPARFGLPPVQPEPAMASNDTRCHLCGLIGGREAQWHWVEQDPPSAKLSRPLPLVHPPLTSVRFHPSPSRGRGPVVVRDLLRLPPVVLRESQREDQEARRPPRREAGG